MKGIKRSVALQIFDQVRHFKNPADQRYTTLLVAAASLPDDGEQFYVQIGQPAGFVQEEIDALVGVAEHYDVGFKFFPWTGVVVGTASPPAVNVVAWFYGKETT